jgi:hypothetical protein
MTRMVALLGLCAGLITCTCAGGRAGTSPQVRAQQNQQVYEVYRQYMEAMNQQREQAGLPPETVKSYEEFRRSPGAE